MTDTQPPSASDQTPAPLPNAMDLRIMHFTEAFNQLCQESNMPAAVIIVLPSDIDPGSVSIRIGGHIESVRFVKEMMARANQPQKKERSRLIVPGGGR